MAKQQSLARAQRRLPSILAQRDAAAAHIDKVEARRGAVASAGVVHAFLAGCVDDGELHVADMLLPQLAAECCTIRHANVDGRHMRLHLPVPMVKGGRAVQRGGRYVIAGAIHPQSVSFPRRQSRARPRR